MSEDIKKSLRTQGKYSEGPNNRDKQQKESPVNKEPSETISHARKRNSNGQKEEKRSSTGVAEAKSPIQHKRRSTHSPIRFPEDTNSSSIKYQDNSRYSFNKLEAQKLTEIRTPGIHTLSQTHNGPSTIFYEPDFIDVEEAYELFYNLQDTTVWYDRNITIHGVEYPQPRLVAWYGPLPYTYSGVTLEPAEMPKAIVQVKERIEEYLLAKGVDVSFNSVLLNCYRNNKDSVAWHSDDELLMAICPTIGSISLGDTRKFEMRRKVESYEEEVSKDETEKCFIKLTHGSLVVMHHCMQLDWQHRIPKEYHDKDMRINLTFRTVHPIDRSPVIMSKGGKKQYEKCINQDAPTNSKINFDDDNFPPLGSTLKTVTLDTEENKDIISPSSNLSSRNDDAKESIEYVSLDTEENKDIISPSSNLSSRNDDAIESIEYVSLDTENCEDIISPNSDLSSKNNSISKSIEHVSDTHSSNTEYWDSEIVNDLTDNWQKTEYNMSEKNINLNDNFIHNSGIASADNSIEKDQGNSIMHASSEHTYVAPTNSTQETWSYAASNPLSNLKSNSILNVEAQEFVPTISPIPTYEEPNYDTLDLKVLLEYNIKDINDDELLNYSYALRKKNMNCDVEFEYFVEDNLNFLNDLMEENQSLRTQRLITERMHKLLCEFFDELDYSGNSLNLRGSYSGQQYNQRDNDNFLRMGRNFRDTSSNRDEMYNRNKRQNNKREQPNRGRIFSSQHSSQVRKRSSDRENYSSRESQRNKTSNRKDNFGRESFSSRGNRNFGREGYLSHDKFSSMEKGNFYSGKYSGKENKNSNRDDSSQRDISNRRKRDSNEKDFNEDDSSDWAKIDSNIEKKDCHEDFSNMERDFYGEIDYNQEEMSSRGDKINPGIDRKNFNGARMYSRGGFSSRRRRNAGRGTFFNGRERNTSRGEHSSQEEFSNRRENRASQEENSRIPPRFSNKGEKNSSRGYSKNRKESLTQGRECVAPQ